jgi:transcriptional regulator with XRE-family HTH domain
LKGLRADADLSGQRLGERIGKGQSWVAKVERGALLISVADVERWADATGASAEAKTALIDQATALHTEGHPWRALHRPAYRRHQEDLRRAEQQATTIRTYQPNVVPGLLQTAGYVRTVLDVNAFGREDPADAVRARVERQAILYDDGKSFSFVITEGALRWRLCPLAVHLAQLDRIASLATLPNVSVGIIPWAVLAPVPPSNMFVVFDDSLVLVESLHGEQALKEQGDVARYLAQFETLDTLARHDEEARMVLDRIASDLRGSGD